MYYNIPLSKIAQIDCGGANKTNTGIAVSNNENKLDIEMLVKVMMHNSFNDALKQFIIDSKNYPEDREFLQAQFITSINDVANCALQWAKSYEIKQ